MGSEEIPQATLSPHSKHAENCTVTPDYHFKNTKVEFKLNLFKSDTSCTKRTDSALCGSSTQSLAAHEQTPTRRNRNRTLKYHIKYEHRDLLCDMMLGYNL